MTLEGPRLLDKLIEACDIDMGESPAPAAFPASISDSQWQILDNLANPTYAARSFYDLSGYTHDDLTTFIRSVDIQEGWGPRGNSDFFIIDLVTTEPIDDTTLVNAAIYSTGDGDLPGFPRSDFNMNQVIYGRTREFIKAGTGTIANQYSTSFFGTGTASNSKRIYITRVCYVDPTADQGTKVHVPPCDYVTAAMIGKEKEIPYLMRLKRSYEIAQRVF